VPQRREGAQRAESLDDSIGRIGGGIAAIVDQPSGKGRVILFAGNPCYRWQNFGEFNLLFNTLLNFNDIKAEAPKAGGTSLSR